MIIDTIRQLLARYYEGEASVREIAALKKFFSESDDIPEDLAVDAAMFRGLASHKEAGCAIPQNLKRRIIAATSARRRRLFYWKAAAAAAVAAALISVSAVFMTEKTAGPCLQNRLTASVGTLYEAENSLISGVSAVVHDCSGTKALHRHATDFLSIDRKQPADKIEPKLGNRYREITDSAEVVEITQQILEKINSSLTKVEASVKYADAATDIMNKTLEHTSLTITLNL